MPSKADFLKKSWMCFRVVVTEILSEEMPRMGNSAVAKYKQIYGNGEEEDSRKLVKVDGKYLMDIGK